MRILIVDDDPDFVRILGSLLEKRAHRVESRPSAFGIVNHVAGVEAGVSVGRPDVVVLDFRIPGLSGGAALELLARDPRTSDVPVLLVSNEEVGLLEAAARQHPRCEVHQKGRMGPIIDHVEQLGATTPLPS